MRAKIEKYVRELRNAIIVAQLNYEIWWVYKEKQSRKRFVDTLNAYPLFFQTSLHAHFVAMIISLYKLFETSTKTINLPQFVDLIESEGTITQNEVKRFRKLIKKIKPLWVKVSILRNNMFGHKSNALDNDDIWKKAKVTPNEFKKLIDESKKVLNEMTSLWDRSGHAFNLSATKDTVDLLQDLERLEEDRL